MKCRDFREFIDSYLSDELLTETNHDIIRHLEECADCRSVIEARRMVRTRLRAAVRSAPDYQMAGRYSDQLRSSLKGSVKGGRASRGIHFGFGNWAAVVTASAIVIAITLGLFLLRGDVEAPRLAGSQPVLIAQLPPGNLVNMAAGDHDHCAVRYASKKPAVNLAQVPARYRDIANVVSHEVKTVLADCDLIDSHSCKFGKTQFTHVILRDGDKMISVLVTDAKADKSDVDGKISLFASDKYSVSRFDFDGRAVFVVSDLDSETNKLAAEALFLPIRKHLDPSPKPGAQTAFLFAR